MTNSTEDVSEYVRALAQLPTGAPALLCRLLEGPKTLDELISSRVQFLVERDGLAYATAEEKRLEDRIARDSAPESVLYDLGHSLRFVSFDGSHVSLRGGVMTEAVAIYDILRNN